MKAPIPQGLTGSPNYFGLLNNLMTLNFCESLREIGEMACVTSAWSSRGQTLKSHTNCRTFQEDDICNVVWHVYLSCFFYNFFLISVGKFFLVVTH